MSYTNKQYEDLWNQYVGPHTEQPLPPNSQFTNPLRVTYFKNPKFLI